MRAIVSGCCSDVGFVSCSPAHPAKRLRPAKTATVTAQIFMLLDIISNVRFLWLNLGFSALGDYSCSARVAQPLKSENALFLSLRRAEAYSANDVADVDEVHLSAVAPVGRVDDHTAAVGAKARMCITTPFAPIPRRRIELPQRDFFAGCDMIQIHVLFSLLVGIGIVQNPSVAGQITAMPILGHDVFADRSDVVCTVLIQIESVAV